MSGARILGDWGSTRLRLWLLRGGTVVDRRDGPGIVGLAQAPADALLAAIAPWRAQERIERITLCGMAGARGGLHEAPYAECPVTPADWRRAAVRFTFDRIPIRIAAGCADAATDVMRGEETQAFGAFALRPELAEGDEWLILPGTHSKWLSARDGTILSLRTFFTGELFALLQGSSLLAAGAGADDGEGGFRAGVARAGDSPGLLGTLFAARAAQLRQGRSPSWAQEFLSGLLIGTEVAEMRAAATLPRAVTLIGDVALTERYRQALEGFGIVCAVLDGEACALAGLGLLDADDWLDLDSVQACAPPDKAG